MQVHLKAINGLKSNILVYNYHIRKRSNDEIKKYLKNLNTKFNLFLYLD